MTSTGIDCSQITALHLLQQQNMRAGLALMECGVVPRTRPAGSGDDVEGDTPAPPNVLVSNRSCTSNSSCTKSESTIWHTTVSTDETVVVNYNDDYPNPVQNYSGTSFSTDNGATFTEIVPPPFATGHGTNYGDPILVYNKRLGSWFAGDLVSDTSGGNCGNQGIGLWTSTDGQNWTTGACAHSGSADDRESMWVDNNPLSGCYGRMYVSWNDFSANGDLYVTYTTSLAPVTWSAPVLLHTGMPFIRDVQLTGLSDNHPSVCAFCSRVYVAGMDEGGGGLNTRQNHMFESTNCGMTWTDVIMGPRFNPPGDGLCASNNYFAQMNPIWRHMGWGQPGAEGSVVHYAYAAQGTLSTGDILYTRSTNNGLTWSTPIVLNDPETNQFQSHWMPSLSVNDTGEVTVSWYDRRQATTACNVVTDPGCNYQRFGVQSPDNGVTWGSNFAISDQIIPQPAQNDPDFPPCYAGDYDYSTALDGTAYVTWTDGRVAVGGVQVQNVESSAVPEP